MEKKPRKPRKPTGKKLAAARKEAGLQAHCFEIKMGACLTQPTKEFYEVTLPKVAYWVNLGKNVAARWLEDWLVENDWAEKQRIDKDGKPAFRKDGMPAANISLPFNVIHNDDEITLETAMYREVGKAVPWLTTREQGQCARAVKSAYGAVLPDDRFRRQRWRGIIRELVSRPEYRSLTIPLPHGTNGLVIWYCGQTNYQGAKPGKDVQDAAKMGKAQVVVRFPVYREWNQKDESWDTVYHTCRLICADLPKKWRQTIKEILSGKQKIGDSQIICKPNGQWTLQLKFTRPCAAPVELDPEKVAVLEPNNYTEDSPFMITGPGGSTQKLGQGRRFQDKYQLMEDRRLLMRSDYRAAGSGARGHGHARYFRDIKPVTHIGNNMVKDLRAQIVHRIVEFLLRHRCGKLIYREPSLGLKEWDWFARRELPCDWTKFHDAIAHQLEWRKIAFEVKELKKGEYDQRWGFKKEEKKEAS